MRRLLLPIGSILLLALLVGLGTACMAVLAGDDSYPGVSTDKQDYEPDETVTIAGAAFEPGAVLDIPVIRPDDTIVKGDGTFEAGWDTIVSGELGEFTYYYKLNGIYGTYTVGVYPSPWGGPDSGEEPLASTTFHDHHSMTASINDGAATTGSLNVTLNLSYSGSGGAPTQMRFANDLSPSDGCNKLGGGSWSAWEAYSASKAWTLAAGGYGERKVCAESAHGSLGSPDGTRSADDTILYNAANPELAASCGTDIALVIDSSGSISSSEYAQMQAAFMQFVQAFLPETPTQFALVEFASGAVVRLNFTGTEAIITNEINESRVQPDGMYTNWQQGLIKAHDLFPNRDNPDLLIFASDGNPNRTGDPPQSVSESAAVAAAVTVANDIKSDGTRIITIGIGDDLDTNNLIAISSADAMYTSGFDTLAAQLAALAVELCGGTISVHKVIDADGDLGTTDDQSNGQG